jgi:hypothetical protein
MEECAICLEPYGNEPAVLISGVPGCTHILGLSCLNAILNANPTLDKKCPICRTVWIPAPRSLGARRLAVAEWASIMGRQRSANGRDRDGERTATLPSIQAPPPPVINLESDSEDGITEATFEQYRRDIADIRSRARNSTLSRQQKREEGTARERKASSNPFLRDYVPTRRPTTRRVPPTDPIEALITTNWRNAANRDAANAAANDFPSHLALSPSSPRGAPSPLEERRRSSENDDDVDVSMLFGSRPTSRPTSPSANVFSSAESSNSEQKLRSLNERIRRVSRREDELRKWQTRLNEREGDLHRQEQALFVREQRVAQRERKKEEFVEMKKRQLDEMRAMAQRHQEEVKRT